MKVEMMARQNLKNFPHSVLLVGAGKMGGSMLQGWLALGLPPENVTISDPHPSADLHKIVADYPAIQLVSAPQQGSDIVILAVKPQLFEAVEHQIADATTEKTLIVSVLAGKTLAGLARKLHPQQPVIRGMPNTPASVGLGMTVLVGNAHVSQTQKEAAHQLMQAVGEVAWIETEEHMDAVTAISGSGPAYIFLLTETLAQAGVALGLEPKLAMQLARQTVSGSGELQRQSLDDVATLRKNVTSPNGTTAAALDVLMGKHGLQELMNKATDAAAQRSRELAN